jgi:putative inorganic carbon (HCO3(-)) transporter
MNAIALVHPAPTDSRAVTWIFKTLHVILNAPEYVFLAALTAMLFSPPDLQAFPIDRLAFLVLVAVASVRLLLRCDQSRVYTASWPMLALLLLGMWGASSQPYDAQAWSLLAAQWIIPMATFHLGGTIFNTPESQRKLQWFSVAVLLYLSFTAVVWLLDLKSLVFPRFILDQSIGIHSDRARGPFLQAVANGVCINVLAILALHAFDRRAATNNHLRRFSKLGFLTVLLLVVTPVALLATKTRAVWLAAALSAALISLFASKRRSRVAVSAVVLIGAVGAWLAWLVQTRPGELSDRLQERSPVEFRVEMYRAGWQMFTEKPLLGWGGDASIQPEIEKRLSSFHPEYYIFHNTYLQLAVEHGALGLLLYLWLFIALFRLGARSKLALASPASPFGPEFGFMWRLMLCVYLVNASVVVMSYQFLNGYIFTIAGILAAQQKTEVGGRP